MKKNVLCLLAVICLTACSGGNKEVKPSGKEVSESEFREKVSDAKYAKEIHFNNGVKVNGSYSMEYIFGDEHKELDEKMSVKGSAEFNYSTMEGYTYTKGNLEVTHTRGGEDVKNDEDEKNAGGYLVNNFITGYGIHCLYDYLNIQDAYMQKLFQDFTFYVGPAQIGVGFKEDSTITSKSIATFDKDGLLKEVQEYTDRTSKTSIERTNDTSFQLLYSYKVEFEYL